LDLPAARRRDTAHVVAESTALFAVPAQAPPSAPDTGAALACVAGSRRLWAAMMLARDAWVWESLLAGRAVRCGGLDPVVLLRALRGGPLPNADSYVVVTDEMLDAVAEAGPLQPRRRSR
jgi:hypothetical protein